MIINIGAYNSNPLHGCQMLMKVFVNSHLD